MTKVKVTTKSRRLTELTKTLEARRLDLWNAVHSKIRSARTDNGTEGQVLDLAESSEVHIQEELEFALIEMKAETLDKIDAALRQIEEGIYGDCFDCGDEISDARLRALPFAVRCRDCEAAREAAGQYDRRVIAERPDWASVLPETSGY